MADKFKVGDVVMLKSGGPKMTVLQDDIGADSVETTWFAGRKCEASVFPIKVLVAVSAEVGDVEV